MLVTAAIAEQKPSKDEVGLASNCVVMPVGRVLLISRENFVAAVKFLRNEERSDGIYSKYEYFDYEKGRFKKVRESEISLKKSSNNKGGIFFHGSLNEVAGPPLKLRDFSLFAHAGELDHAIIYFANAQYRPDLKVRMAPTPWKDISEVNLSDPRIRWFAYDDKETWKIIPIDKIWN
jgi:hypothetical protein